MPRETWYVLENGEVADPSECKPDEKGALTHASGVRVAMRMPDCPMSRGIDIDARTGRPLFAGKGDHDGNGSAGGARKPRDMEPEKKPEPEKKGYKTRGAKAT